MPGRPPKRAVIVQMKNAPYRPISGLRWATSAKAMHSGTSANDEVRPARTLLLMPGSLASQPGEGLAEFIFDEVGA